VALNNVFFLKKTLQIKVKNAKIQRVTQKKGLRGLFAMPVMHKNYNMVQNKGVSN